MERVFKHLIQELYCSMQRKLEVVWPKRDRWFPPESNITFEIARLGVQPEFDYLAYGECDIGTRQRADMLLVSPTNRWICHVECKLLNTDTCKAGSVIADLERVATSSGLSYFLEKVNAAANGDKLRAWKKFGLYVGADVSWMYAWWQAASGDLSAQDKFMREYPHGDDGVKRSRISELSVFAKKARLWGVQPSSPTEGEGERKYWIVYGLFDLS